MIVTLQHFSRALLTPDLSLATLADARPVTEPNGIPRLVRTTRFAEAEVEWRGERWLVAMPLNPSAMPRIERTVSALRKLNTGYLAECRILPGEMRWHDATGAERHTDLVLQHLPAGREFAEALLAEDKATLLAALDTLQAALGSWNSHTTTSRKRISAGTGDGSSRYAITMPASARRSSARVTGRHSPHSGTGSPRHPRPARRPTTSQHPTTRCAA